MVAGTSAINGKHRARRLGEPGILGVGGEDMDTLPLLIVFGGCVAMPFTSRVRKFVSVRIR